MGLAFKPDIDDLRESPAKHVAMQLLPFPEAEYFIVEPNIHIFEQQLIDSNNAYQEADIVVFLVAHKPSLFIKKDILKIELDFCGVRK